MTVNIERLMAEAAAAAPHEVKGSVPVGNLRSIFGNPDFVRPRHEVPAKEQLPKLHKVVEEEGLDFYAREMGCADLPHDVKRSWPEMEKTPAPVEEKCGDGPMLANFIKTLQNTQEPAWKQQTTFIMTGRTPYDAATKTGALSVTVFIPVHTSVCLELPRHMDGVNLTTQDQAVAYITELRKALDEVLQEEIAQDMTGRKFKCKPGDEPVITFDCEFAWRERANGWQPNPDNPSCPTETISYPVITVRAMNTWSARRITEYFANKSNKGLFVPKCPCAIEVNVWESPRSIATDVRVMCENKWKPCGWYRIRNCEPAKWTAAHTDAMFGVSGPACVTYLPDDTRQAPVTVLSFDMECISSQIKQYLKLLQGKVNRFPKATDPTNSVVIICFVVKTADGRTVVVSLQLNDLPGSTAVLHKRVSFHSQGMDIEHDNFLVPNERLLITMFRDFITFYDPDVITSYNGDGFDWPYLFVRMHQEAHDTMYSPPQDYQYMRFYYLGRLIWQPNWQTFTACVEEHGSGGKVKYRPVLNEKDRKKTKWLQFRSMPYGRYASFAGATITLAMSGRTSCDVMQLVKMLGKSNPYYVFERYTLKNVCDRLLAARKFNKLDANLFGYWHRTDRDPDPQNPAQLVPPEEQRERLVKYCAVDAMCPDLIVKDCNLLAFLQALSRITGATLQKVMNAGKTAQITPMFIAKAWDESRKWVCNTNSEGPRDYIGGLVIPPFPQSLAGVDQPTEEDLLAFEEQEKVDDTNYDWSDIWTDHETGNPICEIMREIDMNRECDCESKGVLKVIKVLKGTYDKVNHTNLARVKITLCQHAESFERTCRIPAKYRNKDVVVVLDFQSLYPSIMRTNYNCGSTVRRINYTLDKAERCDAVARLYIKARALRKEGAEINKYIDEQLRQEQAERENEARSIVEARRKWLDMQAMSNVFSSVNIDNLFEEEEADGPCVLGDPDSDYGTEDDSDDGCAKTGTYALGDGDFSHESPEDNKDFVSCQETTPSGQLLVHKLARPHVRRGICYELVTIALDERARIRAEMAVVLQRIKSFPLLTDAMVQAALRGENIHANKEPKSKKEKFEQECLDFACQSLLSLLGAVGGVKAALELPEVKEFIKKLNDLYDRLDIEQNIMKIIANSVYGILASRVESSILSNVNAAACVTAQARNSLHTIRRAMNVDMKKIVADNPEKYGNMVVIGVIYGDTDSVFVHLRSESPEYTWLFLQDAAAFVNDRENGPFKHIRDCKLNLQAEAWMDGYTITGPKTYFCKRDDGKKQKVYTRGVATVRRDKPPVLTKLLSRLFNIITDLNVYPRPVLRAIVLRELHIYMEKLLSNSIPYEDYFITQRIMKLPAGMNFNAATVGPAAADSDGAAAAATDKKPMNIVETLFAVAKELQKQAITTAKKAAQHIEVALEIFRKTGEPPRTGDSSTYVLTKTANGGTLVARPTQDVTIDDIDRIGYLTNRIKKSVLRVLEVLIGPKNTKSFFNIYENAFKGVRCVDDLLASSEMKSLSPKQRRWAQMREWKCGQPPRQSEKHGLMTPEELAERTNKRKKMDKKAVKNNGFSLESFFGAKPPMKK